MILEKINNYEDIKKLDIKQLPSLCDEIRQLLIDVVQKNGGHLASNLGVVELTVALHYVFEESDKIVWDVGHQSYVHKILSGRYKDFDTLRQTNGLSGFPDTNESETDAFNTGHSSTAISAALGMAKARDICHKDYNVIAVVGDGALTGGISYEALNNIGDTKMLVIFNDNEMSISKNVGAHASYSTSKLRVSKFNVRKEKAKKIITKIPLIGKPIWKSLSWIKRVFKFGILSNDLYFNSFNLKYIGPIDGHNIKQLVYYLDNIKRNVTRPSVLHIKTVKGKGYLPAEQNPAKFHGLSPINSELYTNMSNIVGQTLVNIAKEDDKVVAVTAAMTDGTGLGQFALDYKERFFDVGICEEHATTFCAGLAKNGCKPYFVVYSTFLQRGFDQILHDVCLQNLPVTFCIDRAGFVGNDGQTHQGLFDISYLTQIPNMTVLSPADSTQLVDMIEFSKDYAFPLSIRYPKDIRNEYNLHFDCFLWNKIHWKNSNIVLIPTGNRMLTEAIKVYQKFLSEGITIDVVYACSIKPLDTNFLFKLPRNTVIVTMEENVVNGGFGSLVNESLNYLNVYNLGVNDVFIKHGSISEQIVSCGLDADSVYNFVKNLIDNS